MRRYKCQEFAHIAKMCKGKERCARCGWEGGGMYMGSVARERNLSVVTVEELTA